MTIVRRRSLAARLLAVALWWLAADPARAQPPVAPGRWDGSVEFATRYLDEKTTQQSFHSTRFEETLRLRNRGGYVVDPRLATINLGGAFGLAQEHGDRGDLGGSGTTLLNYDAEAILLGEQPHGLDLFSYRNEDSLDRDMAGESEHRSQGHGGHLRLDRNRTLDEYGWRNFNADLYARWESSWEKNTYADNTYLRDDDRTIVKYEASKGFETSDLNLTYDFDDVTDHVQDDADYQTHRANLDYSLDFGPSLNRRFDSRAYYFERDGQAANRVTSLLEQLRLDHNQDLYSLYNYDFTSGDPDNGTGYTAHSGGAGVRHTLYRNLFTLLRAGGGYSEFDVGQQANASCGADVTYSRRIPWNGRLVLGVDGEYRWDDQQYSTDRLDVVDEPHRAPAEFNDRAGFLLGNRFVDSTTIVVVDTRDGVRRPTTEGVDYVVVPEGDYTEIVPLSSSPVILPGDPLEVSYTFLVSDPDLGFSTTTLGAHGGLSFDWGGIDYSHTQSRQDKISGDDGGEYLEDRTLDEVSLDLTRTWGPLRADSTVRYSLLESTRLDGDRWWFRQRVSYNPLLRLRASLNADEAFYRYRNPSRYQDNYGVQGRVDWRPPIDRLALAAYAGYRETNTDDYDDSVVRTGVLVGCSYKLIRFEVDVNYIKWPDRDADELSAVFRVIRQIF